MVCRMCNQIWIVLITSVMNKRFTSRMKFTSFWQILKAKGIRSLCFHLGMGQAGANFFVSRLLFALVVYRLQKTGGVFAFLGGEVSSAQAWPGAEAAEQS